VGSGTIDPSGSIYIGHSLSGYSVTTTTTHNTNSTDKTFDSTTQNNFTSATQLLGDQINDDDNIRASSKFKLYHGWFSSPLDIVGNNTHISSGNHELGIVGYATNDGEYTTGLVRRRAVETTTTSNKIPTADFSANDWQRTRQTAATLAELDYLTASVAGDPHIKTLRGEHYEFDYLGALRMFEYLKNKNSIIINGLAETGPGRWKTKQYIRKIFIQNNDSNILLDMGFRGSPVKVLENNGIAYKEKTLSFDKQAKRYNFDNTMSTLDLDEPITEDLPGLIRNQLDIILEIDNNTEKNELSFITLQNVNEYNLQPCRLEINMSKKLIGPAKGCLIDRKYATVSKLNKITDVTPLEEPTLEDLKNIPELEIEPQKRNIMWK
jgi:hypothetical protein